MQDQVDYYELLHVQPNAPQELIKASYRTLMQKLKMHPDLGGDPETAAQLNTAYATLSDKEQRERYDNERSRIQTNGPLFQRHKKPARNAGVQTRGAYGSATSSPTSPRIMWKENLAGPNCLFCNTPHGFSIQPPSNSLCTTCECPLMRKDSRELETAERRTLERLKLERRIEYRTIPGETLRTGSTKDLSLNGLMFSTVSDLVLNQLIHIISPFCLALSRVAHVDQKATDLSHYGVEFITLCFPNAAGSLISTRA